MISLSQYWKWISNFNTVNAQENEKRSIVFLNRINLIIILVSLLGVIAMFSAHWFLQADRPEIGTLRLIFMMLSGVLSFFFIALQWYSTAKIITSVFPAFFLIIFPTLLGDIKIEYYFYYPPSGIALAMIPIMLFPHRKDRVLVISLVFICFLLSFTADNLMSYLSHDFKSSEIFKGRYFYFKLADLLLFLFIILTVFSLKDINTKYETILADQNARLEKFNNHLEDLVRSRTAALTESESRFRGIFENANDAIFIMKEDVFLDCNPRTAEIFDCTKEQIIGKTPVLFSPPRQPDGKTSEEKAIEKIEAALMGHPQRFEWLHKKLSGSFFDADVSLNCVTLDGNQFLLAIVRDITERKQAEQALKDSEKKFRNIFDKTKHGIIILGQDLNILAANKAVAELSGHLTETDPPLNLRDIMLPGYIQMANERVKLLNEGENLSPYEYKVKYKDGRIRNIEVESSVMDYHGKNAILGILRDVTHIKEAEQKVMEAIIQTEENERSRIAQDLHDGLGPVLSTIKIYFQVYEDTGDQDKRTLLTEKLKSTIEEAIKSISEISHNISPHVLRNYGFYAALKQFIHRITITNVIKINLHCEEELALSQNTGITLYRAITELINNSIKHSGCANINIGINHNEGLIGVEYTDDGNGFDVNAVIGKASQGSGVQNIINRIHALQGKIVFSSAERKGMQAALSIPI